MINFDVFRMFFEEYKPIIVPISFFLVFIILVIIINYFSAKQKIIRVLSKLPKQNVGSLKPNRFSKISGKVAPIKTPLIAPYSKRKCVFYTLKIEQRKRTGKQKRWRTIHKEEAVQDFLVATKGDYVLIQPNQNPKDYLSYLVVDRKTSLGTFDEPSIKFNHLLKQYNINSANFFGFNKQLRFHEGIIEIDESVTVAGIVKRNTLTTPIEGYNYSKIISLVSTEKQKLIITDLPNIKSTRKM